MRSGLVVQCRTKNKTGDQKWTDYAYYSYDDVSPSFIEAAKLWMKMIEDGNKAFYFRLIKRVPPEVTNLIDIEVS